MPEKPPQKTVLKVGELSPNAANAFDLRADPRTMEEFSADLGLLGLRKLRLAGKIEPAGDHDWRLTATIGATVTQPCVVTLEPVTTRIDEPVSRLFLKFWPSDEDMGDEIEMPEDETIDPLGEEIDLQALMHEALALALPVYPRAQEAVLEGGEAAPAGAEPFEAQTNQPFSALADFKKKLEDKGENS